MNQRRLAFVVAVACAAGVAAQPTASPGAAAVGAAPVARYPGTMTVEVDATDIDRKVFHVRQTLERIDGRPDRLSQLFAPR